MAFTDILDRLLAPFVDKLKQMLGPFGKLFDLISKFIGGFKATFDKSIRLAGLIANEIHEWKTFRENVPVRTGVISLPSAIEKSKQLLDEIRRAWDSIVNLAKEVKKQLQGQMETPEELSEEAVQSIEEIEASGVKTILEKFPRFAKVLGKIAGFLAIAIGALESIQSAVDDLTNIVIAIRDIREEIEHGATIFLSQKNPRRIVHLDDGTSMKIRVGNLH